MKTIFPAKCASAFKAGQLSRTGAIRVATCVVAILLASSPAGQGQTLGAAQNVTVLGDTTVTSTGATIVNGNLALSPGTSVTGFPPGSVTDGTININTPLATQAHADAATAYAQLAGETATTNLSGTNLGTQVLTPGVYKFDTSAALNGILTLNTQGNPNAVFVFQIGTTLTTAVASSVILLNGSTPDIYWQVGTSATLGTGSVFDGDILANTSITVGSAADIAIGKVLAINGAVTLDDNSVNALGTSIIIPPTPTGQFWKGGASNLWSGVNWSPTVSGATSSTLVTGANVTFSVTGVPPKNETTTLDVDETISSLTVNDPVPVSISGPHTLTIFGAANATSTITISSGAGTTVINSALDLSGLSQGVTVDAAASLALHGVVSGTIGMTKEGAGALYLTGTNIYSGGTSFGLAGDLTAGTVKIGTDAAIPFNTVTNPTAITPFGTGTITVNAATVLTTDGISTGNSYVLENNFLLTPPLTVNVPTGTSMTLGGNITGTDGLTVDNPPTSTGILILSGNNTYGLGGTAPNEETTVDAGTLRAGSITGFSPNSDFVLNNASTLDLAGFSNSVGSLNGGANAIVTSSAALPNSPAVLTIVGTPNTPALSMFSGNLNNGAGVLALTKNDANTLILNGGGNFSGGTTINAGTLVVGSAGALGNGFATNHATLETTATLGGNVEKINVATAFTQTAAGTLLLQVLSSPAPTPSANSGVAGTNYDTVAAAGAATLGGTLTLNFQPTSVPSQGQHYVAVTAGLPLATQFNFSTTTNLPAPFTTVTTYNDTFGGSEPADSAIVTLIRPFASFPSLTPNQTYVARYVDHTLTTLNTGGFLAAPSGASEDFFNNIVTGLNATTYGNGLGPALDQLSPQRLEILHNLAFDNYAFDVQSLDDELARERTGPGGIDTSGFVFTDSQLGPELSQVKSRLLAWSPAPEPGLLSDSTQAVLGGVEMSDPKDQTKSVASEPLKNWNTFVDGGVDLGDLDHNIDESHSSYTTGRVRAGADYLVSSDFRVGALFAYSHTRADLDNEGSEATVNSYTPGLYAAYADKQGFYANALATYTRNDYSTDRDIVFPGVNRSASGSTGGDQFGGNLDGGYEFHRGAWIFGPNLGLTYVNLGIDNFSEAGAGVAGLNINDQSVESLRGRVGGTVRYQAKIGSMLLTPHLSAFWQREFLDQTSNITSQFEGLPASTGTFTVITPRGDRDNALIDFGADLEVTNSLSVFLEYNTEAGGSSFFGQSASGGVKVAF